MSDQHKDITLEMAVGGNSNITTHNPTDDWDDTKEDPNDNLGRVDSNYFPTPTHHNNAPPGSPPTFTRRMSSQLSIQLERQSSVLEQSGMAAYIPNSIASHIPGLARQKTQKALTATYFCNICFAKYPIDEGFTLRECQHQFCIECMKNFFSNKIEQGIVYLTCFHPGSDSGTAADSPSCGVPIAEADIHQLLDGAAWDKYVKFKSNLDHTLSRQCPYCDATAIGTKDNHIISCRQCAKQYCLYHSNAHDIVEETCESYELRTAKETRMNEMALQQLGDGCQPCPQCEFRIIKSGGCNHMKCVKCGCSFCWLCSEVIEDTELPNHYKSEDSKCKGQQFAGMEDEQPPLSIVVVLILCMCVFCVPGLALGIVFGCLCHPIVSFCCVNDQNVLETVMMCSMVWMMIPAVIILSILIVIWSGLKSTYDNIRSVCNCLPACPDSWIDTVHAQQAQQAQVAQ